MDKEGFSVYLKKGGRSPSAVDRCARFVSKFEVFLSEKRNGKQLAEVTDQDLVNYVSVLDKDSKTNAKGYLWVFAIVMTRSLMMRSGIWQLDYVNNELIESHFP